MRNALRVGMAGLLAAAMWAGASAAFASSGDAIAEGNCSMGSTWKLKAGPDNGRLEVEFEVDSNVIGQRWGVRLSDNGTVFFEGVRRTTAPSGSFEVRQFTANQAGSDVILGQAATRSTGEICQGSVTV